MYLRLKKDLYGTLHAMLLFYKDIAGELMERGFEQNPYDECIANKKNDSKCTILWHVDDLKLSHMDSKVVNEIINMLNKINGKRYLLTVT